MTTTPLKYLAVTEEDRKIIARSPIAAYMVVYERIEIQRVAKTV